MQTHALEGGFANAPIDAAQAFRGVMTALARPGEINELHGAQPPAPLSVAAGVTLLTLCDPETPVHLAGAYDCPAVRDWIAFHTGAPVVPARKAMFALGRWKDLTVTDFPIGTPEYPDRSATLIVECDTLDNTGSTLSGPGIKTTAALSLPESDAFAQNRALFPLGLDFLFTCGNRIAGLPRTTRIG